MKSKIWQTIQEINSVSFKYYIGIYSVLLILDIWRKDFVFRHLRFPLSWLLWFLLLSGVVKLFFDLDRMTKWFVRPRQLSFNLFGRNFSLENYWRRLSEKILKVLFFLEKVKKNPPKILGVLGSSFSYSLIFYLFLLLIEELHQIEGMQKYLFFWEGPVEWFLNPETNRMNWLLGFVVFAGLLSFLTGKERKKKKEKRKPEIPAAKDYLFIFVLGFIVALLVFYKTKQLGWISYVLSVASGLLIILLSIIITVSEKDNKSYAD